MKVRLEPTWAEVTPRGGVWVEAARLRGAVKGAGFKPGAIRYTVTGTLTAWQGQPAVRLSGSESVVLLQTQPGASEVFERVRRTLPEGEGKKVEAEGELVERAAGEEKTAPPALRLRRLEISG